jgi:hypothetical protein
LSPTLLTETERANLAFRTNDIFAVANAFVRVNLLRFDIGTSGRSSLFGRAKYPRRSFRSDEFSDYAQEVDLQPCE